LIRFVGTVATSENREARWHLLLTGFVFGFYQAKGWQWVLKGLLSVVGGGDSGNDFSVFYFIICDQTFAMRLK
jgi:hypothetical protein